MEKHCFCCFFALPSIRQKGPVDLFSDIVYEGS